MEKYDRTFLEGMINRYLKALVVHDPTRLPLAKKVKFTENAQIIPIGEGLWATASGDATYRLYVCDPQFGQVGFFGQMKENGLPILISARLKIEKNLITEIETVVARQADAPWPVPENATPNQVYLENVAPADRISRAELVRITDLYFDGLVQDNGDIVPFDAQCNRIENGMQTTNNPKLALPGSSSHPPVMGCREQINAKSFAYISEINPRQYTVVDEERGITFGTFMFHHKGTLKSIMVPGVGEKEVMPDAKRPFTVVVSELFKIEDRKIRQIEAIMVGVPYRAGSGW